MSALPPPIGRIEGSSGSSRSNASSTIRGSQMSKLAIIHRRRRRARDSSTYLRRVILIKSSAMSIFWHGLPGRVDM